MLDEFVRLFFVGVLSITFYEIGKWLLRHWRQRAGGF